MRSKREEEEEGRRVKKERCNEQEKEGVCVVRWEGADATGGGIPYLFPLKVELVLGQVIEDKGLNCNEANARLGEREQTGERMKESGSHGSWLPYGFGQAATRRHQVGIPLCEPALALYIYASDRQSKKERRKKRRQGDEARLDGETRSSAQ